MQRSITVFMILVAATAFSGTIAAQEKEKQEVAKEMKEVYTCSMHPEVRSDKPGKCPKCGMFLVLAKDEQEDQMNLQGKSGGLTAKEKVQKIKELLAEAKEEMDYNCCLKNPCDRCALDHQSCSCNKDLRDGKGVCSDCYAGWQLGEGKNIRGITKENVKPNFHGHKH